MKKPAFHLGRLLIGGAGGFIAGAAAVNFLSAAKGPAIQQNHLAIPSSSSPADPAKTSPAGVSQASKTLPAAMDFRGMTAWTKVGLAAGMGTLTASQLEALLQECAAWPEPESSEMLHLLLCHWAETDPGAAADWALGHLEQRAYDCIDDIAQIWAKRDTIGLVAWTHGHLTKGESPFAMGIRVRVGRALERFNPVARAEFLEMDCNQRYSASNGDYSDSLRTPEAVKAIAAKLPGHVEYLSDLEELNRQLDGKSGNPRNKGSKNGWNELFEQTATALHRISPQECDAWLAQFPENAQLVARHEIARISKLEGEAKAR